MDPGVRFEPFTFLPSRFVDRPGSPVPGESPRDGYPEGMDDMYTRSGLLLQLLGTHLHSQSGRYLGHVDDGKVFGPDGRYSGTVVGDRVVYRTVDSAATGMASTAKCCALSTHASRSGSRLWGHRARFRRLTVGGLGASGK